MCVRALALINTLYVLGALYGERRTVTQSFIIIIILKLRTKMALPLGRWRCGGRSSMDTRSFNFCFISFASGYVCALRRWEASCYGVQWIWISGFIVMWVRFKQINAYRNSNLAPKFCTLNSGKQIIQIFSLFTNFKERSWNSQYMLRRPPIKNSTKEILA